jgi:hypothetical protein
MITELEFDLPIKTVSELNSRDHWRVRSARRQAQQHDTAVIFKNALMGRKIQLPCIVKLIRIGPKRLDSGDNLSSAFKGIRDQIARIIGIDDGDPRITFQYDQVAIGEHSYNVKVRICSQNGGVRNEFKPREN